MDLSRRRALQLGALAAVAAPLAALVPTRASAAGAQVLVGTLPSHGSLHPGDSLVSPSGRYRLAFYPDGGLALLDRGRQVWLGHNGGAGANRLWMAPNGDLMLLAGSRLVWHSGSVCAPGGHLFLGDDGNLVVFFGQQPVWTRVHGLLPFPAYHPLSLQHVADSYQALVVSGASPTSTYATAYAWQRSGDGIWHLALPAMAARTGYSGWKWAGSRAQGDGSSPAGTFTLSDAYGLAGNPGTRMPYTQVGGDAYRSGDPADPRTYNVHQPSVSHTRTWRVSDYTAERYADYPTQYQHLVNIDVFTPARTTVTYDAAHGEYVTAQPAATGHGFALYLHMNGKGDTAGCVSLEAGALTRVVQWLDPALRPRIAMAPSAWLATA